MNEAVALRICALLEEKKMTKYRLRERRNPAFDAVPYT